MSFLIKKLFFSAIFNSCLFVLLFVGIQNSSNKRKVDLLINESIELPISFIVGSSFIIGSIIGSFYGLNINNETLVLPQVPFTNVPRCFSSYWTLTINDFNSQISLLEDYIDNI